MNFNRAFKYGDCIFETIKIVNGNIMLFNYHYERLKNSAYFLEYNLPNNFSQEYINNLILHKLPNKNLNYRLRLSIFRDSEGFYIPNKNDIKFLFEFNDLLDISYKKDINNYKLGIYEKLYVQKSPLSNIKTNNRIINVMAGLELERNFLDNILLLNDDKNIVESYNSNIFCIKNNKIYTPKLEDGCIKGVFRSFIIDNIDIIEKTVTNDFLLDCDEIFLTNSIQGLIFVKEIFNKKLKISISKQIFDSLNYKLNIF